MVPRLRPRIGIEQKYAVERSIRQRLEKYPGVTVVNSHVAKTVGFDQCKEFRHAVDERLGSYEADIGMKIRLVRKMLSATEANLEPYGRSSGDRRRIDAELREQVLEEARVMWAKSMSLAAAVELVTPL
jgi:hypothetical protein